MQAAYRLALLEVVRPSSALLARAHAMTADMFETVHGTVLLIPSSMALALSVPSLCMQPTSTRAMLCTGALLLAVLALLLSTRARTALVVVAMLVGPFSIVSLLPAVYTLDVGVVADLLALQLFWGFLIAGSIRPQLVVQLLPLHVVACSMAYYAFVAPLLRNAHSSAAGPRALHLVYVYMLFAQTAAYVTGTVIVCLLARGRERVHDAVRSHAAAERALAACSCTQTALVAVREVDILPTMRVLLDNDRFCSDLLLAACRLLLDARCTTGEHVQRPRAVAAIL